MKTQLRRFLDEHDIRGTIAVAVSGGVDSTALLVALHELGVPIVAAHVNHHLRGCESDGDEEFVRGMCAGMGVTLFVEDGTLDPDAIRARGVEAAAREVRHARLHEIRRRANAEWIATAHQKNDQAETILMRLMTGGGIAALRGIHPVRDDRVIRPLLGVTRAAIDDFLRERGITPRFDRSNADPRFLRNRVRALLAGVEPSAIENLAAVAEHAHEQWQVLERMIDERDHSLTTRHDTTFADLPDDPWLRQAILHRHIRRLDPHSRDVSAEDLRRLASEIDAITRVSVTKSLELVRNHGAVVLRKRLPETPDFEIELTTATPVFIPEINTTLEIGHPKNQEVRTKNSQQIELPRGSVAQFVIRNRRDGDRFHPLGMPSEKKLKDFLIDRKIDAAVRDRIPLLIWNGMIAWVAGVEVSERFRVTGTGDLYEVRLSRADEA